MEDPCKNVLLPRDDAVLLDRVTLTLLSGLKRGEDEPVDYGEVREAAEMAFQMLDRKSATSSFLQVLGRAVELLSGKETDLDKTVAQLDDCDIVVTGDNGWYGQMVSTSLRKRRRSGAAIPPRPPSSTVDSRPSSATGSYEAAFNAPLTKQQRPSSQLQPSPLPIFGDASPFASLPSRTPVVDAFKQPLAVPTLRGMTAQCLARLVGQWGSAYTKAEYELAVAAAMKHAKKGAAVERVHAVACQHLLNTLGHRQPTADVVSASSTPRRPSTPISTHSAADKGQASVLEQIENNRAEVMEMMTREFPTVAADDLDSAVALAGKGKTMFDVSAWIAFARNVARDKFVDFSFATVNPSDLANASDDAAPPVYQLLAGLSLSNALPTPLMQTGYEMSHLVYFCDAPADEDVGKQLGGGIMSMAVYEEGLLDQLADVCRFIDGARNDSANVLVWCASDELAWSSLLAAAYLVYAGGVGWQDALCAVRAVAPTALPDRNVVVSVLVPFAEKVSAEGVRRPSSAADRQRLNELVEQYAEEAAQMGDEAAEEWQCVLSGVAHTAFGAPSTGWNPLSGMQ